MSLLKLYKAYNFTDKDPIIDKLRTLFQAAKAHNKKLSYKVIAEQSGMSTTTMYNWFDGKTRRPQFATVMVFVRALDADLAIVRTNEDGTRTVMQITKRGSPIARTNGKGKVAEKRAAA